MKKIVFAALLGIASLYSHAQSRPEKCGTMQALEQEIRENPGVVANRAQIEAQTQEFIRRRQGMRTYNTPITIPVVFHVVYHTNAQNVSSTAIMNQLNQLNLDFAKGNPDTANIPAAFQPLATNTGIQFCLAQRDPQGNATTGINRYYTDTLSFTTNNRVKFAATGGADAWPNSQYLNIWVCNIRNGVLGYAQFPGGNAATDGLVLLYSSLGSVANPATSGAPYNLGRTASHEIGHCLNLRHIWGDDGGACTGSDQVGDTPNQGNMNYGCPTFPRISCNNDPDGDMFMNYMDYTDDLCLLMFTQGQSDRMRALFEPGGAREALANSNACMPVTGFSFGTVATQNVPCPVASSLNVTIPVIFSGGFNTPVSLTSAGAPPGTTISFAPNPVTPGSNAVMTVNNASGLTYGTYTVQVTGTAGTITQTVQVRFNVQGGTAPAITQQPTSQSACAGGSATFTAATSAAGATYQWQVSTNAGQTWTNIPGATSASYTLNNITTAMNAYQYHAVISTGCAGATTNAAALTINFPPAISTQPQPVTTCAGTSATFTAAAGGTNVTYQWQMSTTGCGGTFIDISGATSATYTIPNVTAAMGGYGFRLKVSGVCTPNTVYSNCVLLGTNALINITQQPVGDTACAGTPASFSAMGQGTGLTYQWQVSTDGGASFNDIPGANSATYSIPSATFSMNQYRYRARIAGTCNTAGVLTNPAILTVFSPVTVTREPGDFKGCAGKPATFSVAATGSGISYQWQVSTDGGGTWTNIAGATSNTYTIPSLSSADSGHLIHVVVSGVPCGVITTRPSLLTVESSPTVTISAPVANIVPGMHAVITSTVAPANAQYLYIWTLNNQVIIPGRDMISVPVDSMGLYTLTVLNTTTHCTTRSNEIRIGAAPSENLFIYPNPNGGQFQVRFYDRKENEGRILNVYDTKGARVVHQRVTDNNAYFRMDVKLIKPSAGVYFVDLLDLQGKRLASGKVMVR